MALATAPIGRPSHRQPTHPSTGRPLATTSDLTFSVARVRGGCRVFLPRTSTVSAPRGPSHVCTVPGGTAGIGCLNQSLSYSRTSSTGTHLRIRRPTPPSCDRQDRHRQMRLQLSCAEARVQRTFRSAESSACSGISTQTCTCIAFRFLQPTKFQRHPPSHRFLSWRLKTS